MKEPEDRGRVYFLLCHFVISLNIQREHRWANKVLESQMLNSSNAGSEAVLLIDTTSIPDYTEEQKHFTANKTRKNKKPQTNGK